MIGAARVPAARVRVRARPRIGLRGASALAVSAGYLALAYALAGRLDIAADEAHARAAHLGTLLHGVASTPAAFGLERPPLPTALALPFALLPGALDGGLAVALGTAALGGAGVLAAADLARWARLGRVPAMLFTAAFALHPLLLVAGATGLPEALYATLLLVACGQLLRWFETDTTAPVLGAGAAMGAAFLLRYNVVLVAAAMVLALMWVAGARGAVRERDRAEATALAFLVPLVFAAGLWALTTTFAHGNPVEFVREAERLSALAGEDPALYAQMTILGGDVLASAWWVLRWGALLAAPSLVAIAALALHALHPRASTARHDAVLAAVLASIALPELVALASGQGQPRVTHLFALIVPAFVAYAYAERRAAPFGRFGAQPRQLLATAALCAAALVTIPVLARLPAYEDAPRTALASLAHDAPRAPSPDVVAAAAFLAREARPGEVLADPERTADVMLATGDFARFRTPAEADGDTLVRSPQGSVRFVLVRRPLPGAGAGTIERAHPRLFAEGAPAMTLAFEAGTYRIYRVEGTPPPTSKP